MLAFTRSICALAVAGVTAFLMPNAIAIQRGKTPAGFAFVSGGVSHGELRALHAERDKYSFWLTTAALGSGSHLAGVKVKVMDIGKKQWVLEHVMDGPWLFVALPLGRYEVVATFRAQGATQDETVRRVTTVHKGDRRQMVMYFDSPAELSPENVSPFKSSPYEAKK
jgi:hypothetical protein